MPERAHPQSMSSTHAVRLTCIRGESNRWDVKLKPQKRALAELSSRHHHHQEAKQKQSTTTAAVTRDFLRMSISPPGRASYASEAISSPRCRPHLPRLSLGVPCKLRRLIACAWPAARNNRPAPGALWEWRWCHITHPTADSEPSRGSRGLILAVYPEARGGPGIGGSN